MRRDRATEISCLVMAQRCMDILGQGQLPLPRFKIVTRAGARWVGRCEKHEVWSTCLILVQRYITQDERAMNRVVAHEVIHHVLFMTLGIRRTVAINHGQEFQDLVAKLNAVLGEGFVETRCSDDLGELPHPITLVLARKNDDPGRLRLTWFVRLTPKTQGFIQAVAKTPGYETRLATTRSAKWTLCPPAGEQTFRVLSDESHVEAMELWHGAERVATKEVAPAAILGDLVASGKVTR